MALIMSGPAMQASQLAGVSTTTAGSGAAGVSSALGAAGTFLSAAAGPLAVVGMLSGLVSGAKARRQERHAQRRARAEQRRIEQMQIAEGRRARARQAIAANSLIVNAAAQTGTAGSSGAIGAASSIASQYGSAVAFSQATEQMSVRVSNFEQQAYNAAGRVARANDLYDISKWAYSRWG